MVIVDVIWCFRPHFCSVERPSPCPSPGLDVEDYIQNLPSGYQIEGVLTDGVGSPPDRPLTVHMVPSSSVRLVPTPEAPAAVCSPRASPTRDAALSSFSLAPSDTFSELVTNLISPYLVDSDGVLLTSAESDADRGDDSDGNMALDTLPADTVAAAARPTGYSPQERKSVPGCFVTWSRSGDAGQLGTVELSCKLLTWLIPCDHLSPDVTNRREERRDPSVV